MKPRQTAMAAAILGIVMALFLALPARAEKNRKIGASFAFSLGGAIPQGELWGVGARANVGFSLSAGLRILFGNSCTEPTLFYVPYIVDTKKDGARNGSFHSVMLGMKVFPYRHSFFHPYFMFGLGYGYVTYKGPVEDFASLPEQSGTGSGIAMMLGAGADFNLHRIFSIGPFFYWNPNWWGDCSKQIEMAMTPTPCDPTADRWILDYWLVGLTMSFIFEWEIGGKKSVSR
ncbi:MAG: hypothetical protein ABIJ56_21490 [Pseudomonadota bacterium]